MKKIILFLTWLMLGFAGFAQQFLQAEYYFDNDPGVGNATALTIPATVDTIRFTSSVPTTGLAAGFHYLVVRAKDNTGSWSLSEARGLYISQNVSNAANIVAAEYFIDADPGAGNGTAVNIGASGSTINFTASLSSASLTPGFHYLAIRTKDASGMWGLFEARGFYISQATSNASDIVSAEYFIDTDPGAGAGNTLPIGTTGGTVNFTASIPSTSLAPGFHYLAIRTKNTQGEWGLFETRGFYVSTATTDAGIVMSGEYFFDTDPGIGNGTAFSFTTPAANITQVFNLPVPTTLNNGDHLLVMRTVDAAGKWSLFEFDTININNVLPVTGLTIAAQKNSTAIDVTWSTLTETNSSHFEIERSSNAIDFAHLNRVTATGNSVVQKDYAFRDRSPNQGMNYYRIKQFDRDGNFTYSKVAMVLFNDKLGGLNVYPNPASSTLNIAYTSATGKTFVQVYNHLGQLVTNDVFGQQVIKLDIKKLAKGKYYIRVSDGINIKTTVFIKS